jgi:DNA-binding CsgD family transcriptional regulator
VSVDGRVNRASMGSVGLQPELAEEGSMWDLLGLQDTDESVYRHYLARPRSTLEEAACATGLPPSTVEGCRSNLTACGLLQLGPTGETGVMPTAPAMLAERLRDELDAEHARRRREVAVFQSEMTRLINERTLASYTAPRPLVDRLPSMEAATLCIAEMVCGAQVEVLLAQAEPARVEHDVIAPATIKAAERGVRVGAVYAPKRLATPVSRRAVSHEVHAGVAVRIAAAPTANLTVIDRCAAVLIDGRHTRDKHILLVRDDLLVRSLYHLFDAIWASANDATALLDDRLVAEEVSAEERLLLQLIGDGMKDESTAKRLGVSVRTVRRKFHELQTRLRAVSRFQAGVLAAQRGWVRPGKAVGR